MSYTYNTANELTAMSGPNGSTSYGYDEYGRMTSKSRSSFSASYDYRYGHKLHDVTTDFPGEDDVTYTTGGDGKRRTRTVNSVETWYRWDAGYTVLNEEDDSGNLTRGYVDRNMAHYSSGGSLYEYYFTDHLGSTRALYDGMDDLTATYDYTPYGEHYATQNAATTPHQYTGHDWDPASRSYSTLNRIYQPEVGRWSTRDPLGRIDGTNLYAYVRNNPTNNLDSIGLNSRRGAKDKRDKIRREMDACNERTRRAIKRLRNGTGNYAPIHDPDCGGRKNCQNSIPDDLEVKSGTAPNPNASLSPAQGLIVMSLTNHCKMESEIHFDWIVAHEIGHAIRDFSRARYMLSYPVRGEFYRSEENHANIFAHCLTGYHGSDLF